MAAGNAVKPQQQLPHLIHRAHPDFYHPKYPTIHFDFHTSKSLYCIMSVEARQRDLGLPHIKKINK